MDELEVRCLLSSSAPLVQFDDQQNIWITAEITPTGFTDASLLGTWSSSLNWTFYQGDFNGDGRGDVLGRTADGRWKIAWNLPSHIHTANRVDIGLSPTHNWTEVRVGDFDGDGRDDIAGLTPQGEWWIAYARQEGFVPTYVKKIAATGYVAFAVADINQDGKADIVNVHGNGSLWVTQSDGDTFRNVYYGRLTLESSPGWRNLRVWDANGDRIPDLLIQDATGRWYTAINTGQGSFSATAGNRWSPTGFKEYLIGDFNGDGRDDLAGRTLDNTWIVNFSQPDGTMLLVANWGKWGSSLSASSVVGDFNGDGIADIAGWFPENYRWRVQLGSSTVSTQVPFGVFQPAYSTVPDNPLLPRLLIIGDSISIGYTLALRDRLARVVNVHRIPVNGSSTQNALPSLNQWLGKSKWDFILFNFGMHDLKYTTPQGVLTTPDNGTQVSDAGSYQMNLQQIVQRLQQTGAELIWANTTLIPEGALGRVTGDEILFNDAANYVMQINGIQTIDLHAFSESYLKPYLFANDIHFNMAGSRLLGDYVAASIQPRIRQLVVYDDGDI